MAISAPTPSPIRSRERDFALGAEYFVKIGYAELIQKALDASSDNEPRDIMFVVATLPPERAGEGAAHQTDPRARRRNGSWCRRRATRISPRSCRACWIRAFRLAEIAGNHEILITVIAPKAAALNVKDTTELFSLDLDAKPGFRRAGLKARIDRLVDINRDLRPRARTLSISMTTEGRSCRPGCGRWAGSLARSRCRCGWLAVVVALTFGSAPGKSMADHRPAIAGPGRVAQANGHILHRTTM